MCVILEIHPGVTIPYEMLYNAVSNNEDGYGLVIKHKDKLEVIRECPENGTDPFEMKALLDKHKKSLRYLHLRHRTEGDISLENCHPYTCYDDGDIQIEFMHNGTMYEYKPDEEIKLNGVVTQEKDTRSDSKIFVDRILRPLLAELKVPNYNTPFALKYIGKCWPVNSNRGLIISNKYPTVILSSSEWKMIKSTDEKDKAVEFRASNDTYFYNLSRGRVFDQIEAEKKRKEAEDRKNTPAHTYPVAPSQSHHEWKLVKLKDIDLRANKFMGDDLHDMLRDFDLQVDEGVSQLANLTEEELFYLCSTNPSEAAGLLVLVTGAFARLWGDYQKLEEKHDRAGKLVATQVAKIGALEGIVSDWTRSEAENANSAGARNARVG